MWKLITGRGETEYGPDVTWIDTGSKYGLDKLAGQGVYVPRPLAEKIAELKDNLPPDKVAFYNRALGTFESFGLNRNGDGFERHWLDKKHDTFVKNANYFQHHQNRDPALSRGRPVASSLNERTDMVDLVIVADADKCRDQIQALESGKRVPTSMGCFTADAMVTLSDGTRKPICEIVVGDRVLTHTGKNGKVTKVHKRKYSGPMHEMRAEAGEFFRVTPDHPFWSTDTKSLYKFSDKNTKSNQRLKKDSLLSCDWAHAECLESRLVMAPIPEEVLTPDFATRSFSRIFGYYLAEGHILRNKSKKNCGIHLTVGIGDAVLEEIHDLCSDFGTKNPPCISPHPKTDKSLYIYIHDELLANLCEEHGGTLARHKRFSEQAMKWHPDVQREILGAYLNGDGHGTDKGAVLASTASKDLAHQLVVIMHRLGLIPSIQTLVHKAGSGFSKRDTFEWVVCLGKQFAQSLSDVCSKIKVKDSVASHKRRRIMTDSKNRANYVVTPIVENNVAEVKSVDVYNFEVDVDESYVVAGLAVHNCKVAADVCTICGNKAKIRADYCEHVHKHASPPYGMRQVLDDGRVCGVMNPDPNFFDISDVVIGAAPESETLLKVASFAGLLSGAELAEIVGLDKLSADVEAAMLKRVPGEITGRPLLRRGVRGMSWREDELPDQVIDDVKRDCGSAGVIRHTAVMGMVLSPDEFSRTCGLGRFKAPTEREIVGTEPMPEKVLTAAMSKLALDTLARFYDQRSCHMPALINRISDMSEKTASVTAADPVVFEDTSARAAYCSYRRSLVDADNGDVGGVVGESYVVKCAGTSTRMYSDASRDYVAAAYTSPDLKNDNKILDPAVKIAEPFLRHGVVSGSIADEVGIATLDDFAVRSLTNTWPREADKEFNRWKT